MGKEEEYRELVSLIDSVEVFLLESVVRRAESIRWPLAVEAGLDRKEPARQEGKQIPVTITAQVIGKPESSGSEPNGQAGAEPSFKVEMTWRIVYTLSEDRLFPKETVEQFLDRNVIVNLWPYVREYVSSTSARMNLPPLYLPVAKILR